MQLDQLQLDQLDDIVFCEVLPGNGVADSGIRTRMGRENG